MAESPCAGDQECVAERNGWRVLLHVDQDRDALWLVQALENSDRIRLAWLAKDCEEAVLYLRGEDVFANTAKYPKPNLVIVNSIRRDAAKVIETVHRLPDKPIIVQLTARPDIEQSLRSMGAGANCCQPTPKSLGETIAFVDWLEDWLASIVGAFDRANDSILALPSVRSPLLFSADDEKLPTCDVN